MVHVASIWHTTLERLDMLPVDAVCKGWLDAASLIQAPNVGTDDSTASDDAEETLYFLLQVPDRMAQDILNTHWRPTIEDLLADVVGQPVPLSLVYEAGESPPMHQTPELPAT